MFFLVEVFHNISVFKADRKVFVAGRNLNTCDVSK